jgi:hypothetical protein
MKLFGGQESTLVIPDGKPSDSIYKLYTGIISLVD